jgi:hypothetical protein
MGASSMHPSGVSAYGDAADATEQSDSAVAATTTKGHQRVTRGDLGVSPEQVVQAGDGCLAPDACVSSVMVVAVEPAVKGRGAFSA